LNLARTIPNTAVPNNTQGVHNDMMYPIFTSLERQLTSYVN